MSIEYAANIQRRAFGLGGERHPGAPRQHHAAFANSVTFGVTGWSGWCSGPTMREHWAGQLIWRGGKPGSFSFDEAVGLVEEACYGPLTLDIAGMSSQYCCDDAPGEQEEAFYLLLCPRCGGTGEVCPGCGNCADECSALSQQCWGAGDAGLGILCTNCNGSGKRS